MKRIILITFLIFCISISNAQSVQELFQNHDYKKVIEKANKPEKLSGLELSLVGYSYSMLLDHHNAIKFFDLSFDKGYENFYSHFLKGYSLRNIKEYDKALIEVRKALNVQPNNQELVSEIGLIFYDQNMIDSALFYFEKATTLENTFPEPYYWLARIYDEQQNFGEALKYYNQAASLLAKESHYQIASNRRIAELEFWFAKNYKIAITTYEQLLKSDPTNIDHTMQLMRAYNGNKQYAKADSIFNILKVKYKKNELPAENMKFGNIFFSQHSWADYNIVVRKSFAEPTDPLGVYFKIYVYDKNNEKILKRFRVEKTVQLNNNKALYRLCEHGTDDSHITHPYGWTNSEIPLTTIENAVIEILDK